jgi:hypothetical protein
MGQARLLVKVGDKCAEADAIQAAVVDFLLRKNFSQELVRGIMKAVREPLRGAPPGARVRIVCHPQRHAGALVSGDDVTANEAVGRQVSTGRSVLVLDIAEEIAVMRADFKGAVDARTPSEK